MKIKITEIEADARELRESQTLAQNFAAMLSRLFESTEPFDDCDKEGDDYTLNNFDTSLLAEKVEKWAKEHPLKTRQSEFLRLYPNVRLNNGVIDICPRSVDATKVTNGCAANMCNPCMRKFWLEKIE